MSVPGESSSVASISNQMTPSQQAAEVPAPAAESGTETVPADTGISPAADRDARGTVETTTTTTTTTVKKTVVKVGDDVSSSSSSSSGVKEKEEQKRGKGDGGWFKRWMRGWEDDGLQFVYYKSGPKKGITYEIRRGRGRPPPKEQAPNDPLV